MHGSRWPACPASRTGLIHGLPVGMASGVPGEGAESVELISMWVSPSARGRGVGDHLIRAVERWGG
ncbi:GNAT family N-acetyltransferase [Streptomyces sp. NPDC059070]|uniref:GNAT family N-acetyltransferase n=1 Tax=Streptomyces sp. NPDC059070 TaxID=3346713 RepID=UPI0036C99D6C